MDASSAGFPRSSHLLSLERYNRIPDAPARVKHFSRGGAVFLKGDSPRRSTGGHRKKIPQKNFYPKLLRSVKHNFTRVSSLFAAIRAPADAAGARKPIGGWYYPLCKYVYCASVLVALVAGAALGGIG